MVCFVSSREIETHVFMVSQLSSTHGKQIKQILICVSIFINSHLKNEEYIRKQKYTVILGPS